jgi:acetylornithine deacetylase/succinyl-diaminopimelate desuccinylase-like protein
MGEETAAPAETQAGGRVTSQAVALLQELIRINTGNPPGNEQPAQELLAHTLSEAGFDCELLAAEPGRPNLVARLRGESPGPTLCLLGHVDTVPADPSEWSFDPWAGDVVDGEVRGRGAQDMKDQVAAEVAAAAALGRQGWRPPKGELLVVTTADEETGAAAGAQWLCREHPDKVRSDYVLNEGGGISFELHGGRVYTLCVGEKGPCRFLMRARGVAGHASVPGLGDNALLKLAPALERLRQQPPLEPTPEGVAFIAALTGEEIDGQDRDALAAAIERLREAAPEITAYLAEPMVRVTLVPTMASASPKENVIPARAEVLVDCRVPPGMGRAEALDHARAVLGEAGEELELEFTDTVVGNRSSADSPLAAAIGEWLAEADPEATLVPIVMAGFSDSHWFRQAFDSAVVYGFCPQREMALTEAMPLVHGADERAAVADIDFAERFYRDIVQAVLRL